MEGRRGVALALCCAVALAATGCGDEDPAPRKADTSHDFATTNPELTLAPVVRMARDEPWRPMSARWFIERSVLWMAEDQGCRDNRVAVGHTLPEQQDDITDWIYPHGLGPQRAWAYYRVPSDESCEADFDRRVFADQLNRPHDPGPRTLAGARPEEGFYLDLVDAARPGPPLHPARGVTAPAYVERTDEGDGRVRLTYWLLFGMNGESGVADAHEGDWERVDVLLEDRGGRVYVPLSLQLVGETRRTVRWSDTQRLAGGHPAVAADRATHTLSPVMLGKRICDCVEWATWRSLADLRKQPWHGFGGAWGEVGRNSATTGPLGPHGFFPTDDDKRREVGDY